MIAAAIYASKNFQFDEAIICDLALMSTTDTVNTSVEPCSILIVLFDKLGNIMAKAWGNTIRLIACLVVMPIE
ncbi:hypothetical protein D3C81_2023940 [compost metagenome]